MLTRVDLPAPFGPITAVMMPGLTSKETSSIAFSAPELFGHMVEGQHLPPPSRRISQVGPNGRLMMPRGRRG